jgi:hypothetical protein
MRYLIGIVAAVLLLPLWYAMSGAEMPAFISRRVFGIPVATLIVLAEMAMLVCLSWLAMKVVARDTRDQSVNDVERSEERV